MSGTLTATHPWLAQFPRHQQGIVRAWFAAAKRPEQSPEDLLHAVAQAVAGKFTFVQARDTQQLCEQVLLALLHQRPGARQFAASLLDSGQVLKIST